VRAGAGIVADSDPEKELTETVHKMRSVARALELQRTCLLLKIPNLKENQ